MGEIRKISIGSDLKSAMHYIVGQDILNGTNKIHHIFQDDDGIVFIWIENEKKEVVLWKKFNKQIPITIEFNINF